MLFGFFENTWLSAHWGLLQVAGRLLRNVKEVQWPRLVTEVPVTLGHDMVGLLKNFCSDPAAFTTLRIAIICEGHV